MWLGEDLGSHFTRDFLNLPKTSITAATIQGADCSLIKILSPSAVFTTQMIYSAQK